ncbi:uncharacterized protein LOC125768820 isoform X2 [Anopheles funestus]|uniref:uncharacterized protein LOC125768820 isoform X2 n=1 Tax=Anopheles funestus TaxID=62324 RepID=UPI0020C606FD|nr:uncharacterized protein LOC125768820 isoform X2 [Anopheles funestus]
MEHSLNQRDGRKPSPASIEGSSTIKQEPLDEEMKEPKIEIPQEASFWECGTVDPLKEEIDIGETGFTVQDPFFMIEEIGIKVEPKVEKDEEIEDHGDTVDTNIADDFAEDNAPARRKLKTTSDEDRKRIVIAYENGSPVAAIAETLNINRSTVYNVLRKYNETMKIEADKRGKVMEKKITPAIHDQIIAWIDEDCTISLYVLTSRILEKFNVRVCRSTVAKEIGEFNYSLKTLYLDPEKRNDANALLARKEYAIAFSVLPSTVPDNGIVFVDEVGFRVSMRVMRERLLVGTKAVKVVPQIRTRNIYVVCAMNRTGIVHYMTSNHAIDRHFFVTFINELKQKLREISIPRAVVIMDNVAFHKCTEVKQLFKKGDGRAMYLPPYSPFLNPIENVFSNWKNFCKRANPQCEDDVMSAITNGWSLITATDCKNYFQHMWNYIPRCLREEAIED